MIKLLKIIIYAMLILIIIALGAYFYISSEQFIQTQVLPRISKSLGTDVKAGEVAFSALSAIEFKDLRIGDDADPLLRAGTIRVKYRALSLLSKKVEVKEVLLSDVKLVVTPEKLEAVAKSAPPKTKQKPSKPAKPSEPSELPEILVQNVKIQNLSASYIQSGSEDERMELQVPQLNLDLPELATGKDFHLTLASKVKAVVGDQVDAEVKDLSIDLTGTLGRDLMPTSFNLEVNLKDISGTAGPVALAGRRVEFSADLAGSPASYDVKKLGLTEFDHDTKDAEVGVSGSLGVTPLSATLDLFVNIPAGSLLNMIGALAGGMEFGQTAISYMGHVDMLSQDSIASRGELNVHDLTVAVPSANVPALRPLQISANHDLGVDLAGRTITLSKLDATVSDGAHDVVTVGLDKAMKLDLQNPGGNANARLSVHVDRLDLTMLNAFLAKKPNVRILSGEVNRAVTLDLEQGGREIDLDVGGGGIDKLVVQQGEERIGPLRINHEAKLQVTDFKTLDINHFKVELVPLAVGLAPAATVSLAGQLELAPQPTGKLTADMDGDGEKLMTLAKPFLGDLDLTIGRPKLAGKVVLDCSQGTENPDVDLQFKASGIEANAPSLGLIQTVALDLDSHLHAGLQNGKNVLLDASYLRINGFGYEKLVDVDLDKTSFALDDMQKAPEKVKLPVRFAVNNLDLSKLMPFIPRDMGVSKLAGNAMLNGSALLTGPAKTVHLEAKGSIDGLDFTMRDGTRLASAVTPSIDSTLDYTVGGVAKINHLGFVVRPSADQEPLLNLDFSGSFDTSMNPNVKNTLNASTQDTVALDQLEKLIVRTEKQEEAVPVPEPAPVAGGEVQAPPNLWIEARLAMEKATYRQLLIENLAVEAEYRNGKLNLPKADVLVNKGTICAQGVCDLSNPKKPTYDIKVDSNGLQFAPVFSTFLPKANLYTKGGLQAANMDIKGTGFDMASLQKNLTAKVNIQLDQLTIEKLSGTAGKLTEALLLSIFNIDFSDLSFGSGGLKLAIDQSQFGNNDVHIQQLQLRAPVFMLDGSGTVQFGGKWIPDMEIKTGFSGSKASNLRDRGFNISTSVDDKGFYAGPTIPLKGDLTSLRNQASLVSEVLIRSGKLSPEDALKADVANEVIGIFGGNKEGEEKRDVGATIGNILQGVLETQQPEEEEKKNEKKKKDDSTDAIGNVLKGLFGN